MKSGRTSCQMREIALERVGPKYSIRRDRTDYLEPCGSQELSRSESGLWVPTNQNRSDGPRLDVALAA